MKIINSTSKNKGFSLIELLVGIAIIITATTIVLSIIVSSFRISSKTTSNSVIRQNGSYAMSQMSRMLQFADSFEGAGDVDAATPDVQYQPLCSDSGDQYNYLKIKYKGLQKVLSCTNSGIAIDGNSIIDSTGKISVVPDSCSFICSQTPGSGPVIRIDFSLKYGSETSSPEKSANTDFSTTVKMRNP